MSIQSINPATGEILESFKETSGQELDRILMGAHAAFLQWREVPFARRAQRMREAAQTLRTRRAEYARTMTLEMGKPIVQGEAEVDKCAWVCERITPRPCSPSSRARRRPRGVTSASIPSGPCLP